jgi:hypothetical protein
VVCSGCFDALASPSADEPRTNVGTENATSRRGLNVVLVNIGQYGERPSVGKRCTTRLWLLANIGQCGFEPRNGREGVEPSPNSRLPTAGRVLSASRFRRSREQIRHEPRMRPMVRGRRGGSVRRAGRNRQEQVGEQEQ